MSLPHVVERGGQLVVSALAVLVLVQTSTHVQSRLKSFQSLLEFPLTLLSDDKNDENDKYSNRHKCLQNGISYCQIIIKMYKNLEEIWLFE
jgi:hypothetical protein